MSSSISSPTSTITLGNESESPIGGGAGLQRRLGIGSSTLGGADTGVLAPSDTTSCVMALPSLSRLGSTGTECRACSGGADAGRHAEPALELVVLFLTR